MSIETAIIEIDNNRQVITTSKLTHQEREDYNKDNIKFLCCECSQHLVVSTSNKGRVHLKHKPKSNDCILKSIDERDKELIEDINQANYSRESDIHKELKNKIAFKLSNVEGVTNIEVEKTIISENGQWRRPDVSCIYNGNKIGFEVQLSSISQRYVLRRKEFYDNNGIYLIWILDGFNKKSQNQTEKDIKYLKLQQSIFSVNESDSNELLKCQYKEQFIKDFEIHEKWTSKLINLKDIIFDKNLELYFYNRKEIREKLKTELVKLRREEEVKNEKIALEKLKAEKLKESNLLNEKKHQRINCLNSDIQEYREEIIKLENLSSEFYVESKIADLQTMISEDDYDLHYEEFIYSSQDVKSAYISISDYIKEKFRLNKIEEKIPNFRLKLNEGKRISRKGFNQEYIIVEPKEYYFIEYESNLLAKLFCTKVKPIPINYDRNKLRENIEKEWQSAKRRISNFTFFISLDEANKYYDLKLIDCNKVQNHVDTRIQDGITYLISKHKEWKKAKIEKFLKKITQAENELKELK